MEVLDEQHQHLTQVHIILFSFNFSIIPVLNLPTWAKQAHQKGGRKKVSQETQWTAEAGVRLESNVPDASTDTLNREPPSVHLQPQLPEMNQMCQQDCDQPLQLRQQPLLPEQMATCKLYREKRTVMWKKRCQHGALLSHQWSLLQDMCDQPPRDNARAELP